MKAKEFIIRIIKKKLIQFEISNLSIFFFKKILQNLLKASFFFKRVF